MSVFKKITNKIQAIIVNYYSVLRIRERETSYGNLVKNKETDFKRWKNNKELDVNWNERTAIIAEYIEKNANVIEFGAGNMYLKELLQPKNYTPSDIVKRFKETIVCDLNKEVNINLKHYDTAVFSGVLEYVHDIDFVFNQLKNNELKQVVMSYCCTDIVELSRDKNGWLSNLTKRDLLHIFNRYKYDVVDYCEWNKQSIFNLKQH